MRKTAYYTVEGLTGNTFEDALKAKSRWDADDASNHGWMLEECAEQFYNDNMANGGVCVWPIRFTLWHADGRMLRTMTVKCVFKPEFYAS